MKVKYNKETDVIYIKLSSDKIVESDETKDGVIIDYSENGSIVTIEILQASKKTDLPGKIEYEAA